MAARNKNNAPVMVFAYNALPLQFLFALRFRHSGSVGMRQEPVLGHQSRDEALLLKNLSRKDRILLFKLLVLFGQSQILGVIRFRYSGRRRQL
jgi:hypothetical protein